jgi:hypothetical protein
VITARVALNVNGAASSTATRVYFYVDGKIIRPEGVATALEVLTDQASKNVSPGRLYHVQTVVNSPYAAGYVTSWDIEYSFWH